MRYTIGNLNRRSEAYGKMDGRKRNRLAREALRPPALQRQKLYRLIVDHDPLQLKFPFALWTSPLIRERIRSELLQCNVGILS